MKTWLKRLGLALLLLSLVAGIFGYQYYQRLFASRLQLTEAKEVYFPSNANLNQIADILMYNGILKPDDVKDFQWVAEFMKYKGKAGKYTIKQEVKTLRDLVQVLRGEQTPVKLVFHNLRKKEQLAGLVAKHLEVDSAALSALLNDSLRLSQQGLTPRTAISLFIPNTYQFHWDTNAEEFFERMLKEHKAFWTAERLEKAKALELSPAQVYTLASIVETETRYNPEKPRIAGVYLNRLKKNWKLEADPTVIFAHDNFEIRRVLKSHLELDSPYNTYKYEGLPPGPIYMASVASIDAVLNAEAHEYMFFCARPDNSGSHAFAKTLAAHNENARAYHRWLNSLK